MPTDARIIALFYLLAGAALLTAVAFEMRRKG
jgi:hypothetical protein